MLIYAGVVDLQTFDATGFALESKSFRMQNNHHGHCFPDSRNQTHVMQPVYYPPSDV